ncbi:MAG TPA: YeeE/YedE thiosulfate transporter family protein [Longimicrobiales bacterium]
MSVPTARARAVPHVPGWAALGIIFGLLSATAIALYGPIGVSGTYPRLVGAVTRQIAPGVAAQSAYLEKMGSLVTTESTLVVGLLIGGFLSALLGRQRAPAIEKINANETTSLRRYANAFGGGFLIIFGARLAGGCTSGHIISGMTQLSLSAFIFGAGVFGAGMFTAHLLKGGR